ncbi:MAG: hypothetical protein JXQ82_09155 [Methanomicrobiaceae archaeon]|nr:hypothetical protein [Methanomicrobiaceae archaeon]
MLQKFGCRIFYIRIEESSKAKKEFWVEKLKNNDILPLPIESLPHISETLEGYSDPQMKIIEISREYAPKEFISCFLKLFPNNSDIAKKLEIVIHWSIARKMRAVTSLVNIWAREHKDKIHLLIDIRLSGILTPGLLPNVKLLVIPLDIIENIIKKVFRVIHNIKNIKSVNKVNENQKNKKPTEIESSKIAFIMDSDGPLPYSDDKESELHRENILHLYYRFFPGSSEKIKWGSVWNPIQILDPKTIYHALIPIRHGILHVRSIKQIIGLFIIAFFYTRFRFFLQQLERYPCLKAAFIKNDIYSPKALLIALEAKGIKTVALQYRFDLSNNYLVGSTILTYYLCASQFVADIMQDSPIYCIEKYVPVGLYRSDKLFLAKGSPPPAVLKVPVEKGYHVITALGWTVPLNWYESQSDYKLNQTAHKHFLEDMYRLSVDIPDVFIIIRYVSNDWMALPLFTEIIAKIMASEKMTISTDYDNKFANYDLCAHSELVITNKHDRIANDCLSVGIPVLFHNYSHNTKGLVWNVYASSKVMCNNYSELLDRTRIVLSGVSNEMTQDYNYLKNVVLGGLGDGKVKERVNKFIGDLLS